MKKTIVTALLAVLVLSSCSAKKGPTTSPEKVLQPWPMPAAEWRGSRRVVEDQDVGDLEHISSGDTLTTVTRPKAVGLAAAEFRIAHDEAAGERCTSWTSQLLDETSVRTLPRQIWLTECYRKGHWQTQLNLYITGKDAGYFVIYGWKARPDAAAVEKWAAYMRGVTICDDRADRGIPCPDLKPTDYPPL